MIDYTVKTRVTQDKSWVTCVFTIGLCMRHEGFSHLIDALGRTQASKRMELLSLAGLEDRNPSSLHCCMQSLNPDPKTLLRALFLTQLPINVCRVLAGSPTSDLIDLAKKVDAVMDSGSLRSSAISISGVHNATSLATTIKPKKLCFYHSKFVKDARKCNQRSCKMAHLVPSAPAISVQKWTDQPMKTSAVSTAGKNKMTMQDHLSGKAFLIDCGAEESMFPASAAD